MNKKRTMLVVVPVLAVVAVGLVLWFSRSRDPPPEPPPAVVPAPAAPVPPVPPSPVSPVPAPEQSPAPPPVAQEQPWAAYVGHWEGKTVCVSDTRLAGKAVNCFVHVDVADDGTVTMKTGRTFQEDGSLHGRFSESGAWPGNFGWDGILSFVSPSSGVVRCTWLATVEKQVDIPIARTR